MYEFNPEIVIESIKRQWRDWAENVGAKKFVFGVSGGKDSTVVAYLASTIFGKKNCCGVMMPNGQQADISDSQKVVDLTGIDHMTCNINLAFEALRVQLEVQVYNPVTLSENARINLAPRLRMATLYAVAQSIGGAFVINTDNLSERILGYFTAWGDGAGDYAPLRDITATEVVKIGEHLGIPDDLIHKKPGDGLQELGDEDRFGFTYAEMDNLIRTGNGTQELKQKVLKRYCENKFKTQIVNIPGPVIGLHQSIVD